MKAKMKEKVKEISKYVLNALNMINAIIIGLAGIWNWNVDKISITIVFITGIISAWLIKGKLFDVKEGK